MKIKNSFSVLLIILLFQQCNSSNNLQNKKLYDFKQNFSSLVTNQFPNKIDSNLSDLNCDTNSQKNDVGLYLIEYNLSDAKIAQIKNEVSKKNIALYKTSENDLLKVNMYETKKTKLNYETLNIIDSAFIKNHNFKYKYPIPNFIFYNNEENKDFWKENFDIYVIESKREIIIII